MEGGGAGEMNEGREQAFGHVLGKGGSEGRGKEDVRLIGVFRMTTCNSAIRCEAGRRSHNSGTILTITLFALSSKIVNSQRKTVFQHFILHHQSRENNYTKIYFT